METAINIGYNIVIVPFLYYFQHTNYLSRCLTSIFNCSFSCSLLRQGMKQLVIQLESPEIHALEKAGDKRAIAKVNLI